MKKLTCTCTIFYIIFVVHLVMFGLTMIYSGDLKHLEKVLDKKQLEKYQHIKRERLNHFYTGVGVGSIIGLCVILSDMKMTSGYCLAGILLLFTTVVVYYILPKSDYMLRHLNTEEQKMAWLTVNRNFMKRNGGWNIYNIIVFLCSNCCKIIS